MLSDASPTVELDGGESAIGPSLTEESALNQAENPTPSTYNHSSSNPSSSNVAPSNPVDSLPSSTGAADIDLWRSGILAALEPGIKSCDQQVTNVFLAQQQLATQIDRLNGAIQSFHSLSRTPSLLPYTTKLVNCKKRLKKSSTDIGKVMARLEEIRTLVKKKEGIVVPNYAASSSSSASNSSMKEAKVGLFEKLRMSVAGSGTGPSKENSPNRSRQPSVTTAQPTVPNTNNAPVASEAASTETPSTTGTTTEESSAAAPSSTSSSSTLNPHASSSPSPPQPLTSREKLTNLLNWEQQPQA